MRRVISKLLAITLSLAMVLTGFGWVGAVSVNAAGEAWAETDFTYEGSVVTGLSEEGTVKLESNTDVVIPDKNGEVAITELGSDVFAGTAVTTVKFPETLTKVGDRAFQNCGELTAIDLPDSVTEVGMAAFSGTNKVASLKLSQNLTTIGGGAFQKTSSGVEIDKVVVPSGVKEIPANAFGGLLLSEIEIPEGVTSIGARSFMNSKVASLVIPASVTEIGSYAFSQQYAACTGSLKSVTLNEGLQTIDGNAFAYSGLESITIPSTVTSIKKTAFNKSTNVVNVYIENAALLASDNPKGMMNMILSPRTVTFDANGGTTDATTAQTGDKGTLASIPEATKEKNNFKGWFTAAEGGDQVTETYIFAESMTVYAQWELIAAAEINNLPAEVAVTDKEAIEKARADYDALTDEEKASLPAGTVEKLEAAEAKLDAAVAKEAQAAAEAAQKAAEEEKAKAETAAQEANEHASAVVLLANNVVDAALLNTSGYKTATVNTFKEALEAAQTALKKEDATTEELTSADAALKTAKDGLVLKDAQPMTVKAKTATVKYAKVKKKAQKLAASKVVTVSKQQGKVTYKKLSGNKKITIASNGKVTVKKGLKKGTYKVKVKVTAAGNDNYKAGSKTVTFKIKVK